jgi:hypothetical protein
VRTIAVDDRVIHGVDVIELVCRDHDRPVEGPEDFAEPGTLTGIESGGWLIEEKNLGWSRQDFCESHPS